MPGPFINNDGYEPMSWGDEKKPAAPTEAERLAEEGQKQIALLEKLAVAVTAETIKHTEWKQDCQGKMDFDITLFSLSCRYYPDNTAYATLYLSTSGGHHIDGIPLEKFHSEPGNYMGAPNAKAEIMQMAQASIQKFAYALLRICPPEVIAEAVKEAKL